MFKTAREQGRREVPKAKVGTIDVFRPKSISIVTRESGYDER